MSGVLQQTKFDSRTSNSTLPEMLRTLSFVEYREGGQLSAYLALTSGRLMDSWLWRSSHLQTGDRSNSSEGKACLYSWNTAEWTLCNTRRTDNLSDASLRSEYERFYRVSCIPSTTPVSPVSANVVECPFFRVDSATHGKVWVGSPVLRT